MDSRRRIRSMVDHTIDSMITFYAQSKQHLVAHRLRLFADGARAGKDPTQDPRFYDLLRRDERVVPGVLTSAPRDLAWTMELVYARYLLSLGRPGDADEKRARDGLKFLGNAIKKEGFLSRIRYTRSLRGKLSPGEWPMTIRAQRDLRPALDLALAEYERRWGAERAAPVRAALAAMNSGASDEAVRRAFGRSYWDVESMPASIRRRGHHAMQAVAAKYGLHEDEFDWRDLHAAVMSLSQHQRKSPSPERDRSESGWINLLRKRMAERFGTGR
jgi:hypothetical protein